MNIPYELRTPRLLLRRWKDSDREPFARLNADSEVMQHFPQPLTRAESDDLVDRIELHFREHGFCFWAVEVPGVLPFAGFVGLACPPFDAPFTPCVEVGWRLARECWGRGYATEGARASLTAAFGEGGLEEVVAFTVPANWRSRRVMERLGMGRNPADDFEHPKVPAGHPLRPHVLYRISATEFSKQPVVRKT